MPLKELKEDIVYYKNIEDLLKDQEKIQLKAINEKASILKDGSYGCKMNATYNNGRGGVASFDSTLSYVYSGLDASGTPILSVKIGDINKAYGNKGKLSGDMVFDIVSVNDQKIEGIDNSDHAGRIVVDESTKGFIINVGYDMANSVRQETQCNGTINNYN